jgi:hypothetical protein
MDINSSNFTVFLSLDSPVGIIHRTREYAGRSLDMSSVAEFDWHLHMLHLGWYFDWHLHLHRSIAYSLIRNPHALQVAMQGVCFVPRVSALTELHSRK